MIAPTRCCAAFFALCLALSSHAATAADPVADAIARAERQNAQNEFDASVRLLEPYESLQRPDVDFALAQALYSASFNGVLVQDGQHVDISRPLALAERAAATGNGYALNLLYTMHSTGLGMPADFDKARRYLERAVEAGDVGAKLNYAISLYGGNRVVDRDRAKACGLFKELGAGPEIDAITTYYLGLAHFSGECGFDEDRAKGVSLIEVAARSEVREAQAAMGKNHEFGWVGEKDINQALAWYQLAADLGEPYAEWRIGMAYVSGENRARDPAQAVAWFERSVAQEHAMGLASLAVMSATGDGTPPDFAKARSLYERAAAAGNPHGYLGLAVMHLLGQGGAADPVRAWVLYSQAIAAGSPQEPALLKEIEIRLDADQRKNAERAFEASRGKGDSLRKAAN